MPTNPEDDLEDDPVSLAITALLTATLLDDQELRVKIIKEQLLASPYTAASAIAQLSHHIVSMLEHDVEMINQDSPVNLHLENLWREALLETNQSRGPDA